LKSAPAILAAWRFSFLEGVNVYIVGMAAPFFMYLSGMRFPIYKAAGAALSAKGDSRPRRCCALFLIAGIRYLAFAVPIHPNCGETLFLPFGADERRICPAEIS
jgi:hypothetical protein